MKNNWFFEVSGIALFLLLMLSKDAFSQSVDSATLIRSIMTPTYLTAGATNSTQNTVVQNPDALVSKEVQVYPSTNPQSEIHISINKTSPRNLLLSSNTLLPNISYQGAWWSTDGGNSWNGAETLPNNSAGRNDPGTAFDASGVGYISTLTPVPGDLKALPISYSVQKTSDNGTTWSAPVHGTGNITIDKPMIGVDDISTSPYANRFYCGWMGANMFVQFNESANQGVTFSAPVNLTAYWGQGTNVQTGLNGQVYICWADYNGNNITNNWTSNGLDFCTSTNGGQTFTVPQRVLQYVGIRQFNQATHDDENPNFNMTRVNDFPSMAVDKSTGSHHGRIYVTLPLRQNGNGKAIVQVSFSDNQGVTWSAPVTVSIMTATQSWFPWVAVDASTGIVYVTYYALDQVSGFSTNTYVATSDDGGATFSNQKVSSVSHITAPISGYLGGYAGDYIGIDAYALKAYSAWMDNRTGQWQDFVVQLDNTPQISGVPAFCSSTTYTVSNLLPNTTVTWSVSPSGVISINPSGNQVTATKITQGYVTLYATVNQLPNTVGSINLTTVPQVSSIVANMSGTCTNGIQSWYVSATPNMATSTNWNWTVDNPNSGIHIDNPNSQNTFMEVSKGGGVSVTYVDACAELSLKNGTTIYSPCGHQFSISPNPASSTLNINAVSESGTSGIQPSTISEVNIYDLQNTLRKHQILNNLSSASIDVTNLPIGIYVVEVVDDTYKERQELQILR